MTIQGNFAPKTPDTSDTANTSTKQVTAGCKLDAFFPYYHEDIFFGEDGCLYDATGKNSLQNLRSSRRPSKPTSWDYE